VGVGGFLTFWHIRVSKLDVRNSDLSGWRIQCHCSCLPRQVPTNHHESTWGPSPRPTTPQWADHCDHSQALSFIKGVQLLSGCMERDCHSVIGSILCCQKLFLTSYNPISWNLIFGIFNEICWQIKIDWHCTWRPTYIYVGSVYNEDTSFSLWGVNWGTRNGWWSQQSNRSWSNPPSVVDMEGTYMANNSANQLEVLLCAWISWLLFL